MTRSPALSLLLTTALMVALAQSVLAKEPGIMAQLQTAIPPDAEPGVQIDVAFTLTALGEPPPAAYDADPLSIRVVDRNGAYADVLAVRDRPGHYVGTITVPQAGIDEIYATLPGEGPAPAVWKLYAAPPVGSAAEPATATPPPAAAPTADALTWVIAAGVLVALAAGVAAAWILTGRRRGRAGATPSRI
ncbi:MAG TPA: hypothetical protein VM408_02220 [Methylomirabilota bacterium]|nr:hypothetical protein [Methylomirabilota bacterium]